VYDSVRGTERDDFEKLSYCVLYTVRVRVTGRDTDPQRCSYSV
jgi:hypothetical protein